MREGIFSLFYSNKPQYFNEGGIVSLGNIDLSLRPILRNPDGSISTIESISIGTDAGEVLIPTISPQGRRLSDEEAIQLYETTGQHLGVFRTPEDAKRFARELSERMSRR